MTKLFYVAIAIASVAGGIAVIRLWVKPEVVYVPVPMPSTTTARPPIREKSFDEQFQPKPPPPNGGRYTK